MRIAELPRSLEPGDMYASVFVKTTASVTSATPRADPRINRVVAHSPLVEKGNEIQRCSRLYELTCRVSTGTVLLFFESIFIDQATLNGTRPNSPLGVKPATVPS